MDLKLQIKELLQSKNKSLSNEDLDKAVSTISEKIKSSPKRVDEDGHIIVAENVKVSIGGAISSATEIKE